LLWLPAVRHDPREGDVLLVRPAADGSLKEKHIPHGILDEVFTR
jgi:hypothetical protein